MTATGGPLAGKESQRQKRVTHTAVCCVYLAPENKQASGCSKLVFKCFGKGHAGLLGVLGLLGC